ncbi:MAG: glycoside hydrolase family 28 protein [Mucilaginibacter sp.]|nr:glycoside hydrolase family 28 protein [Mucilaginibacter sp.]
MKIKIFITFLLACATIEALSQGKIYNISRYGAVADAITNNTTAIQKAIDEASAKGGGTVLVPAGKFVTGVITIKSNVELHLDKDAFLLGSPVRADYGAGKASALIVADHQHHIAITGQGTIDGQGEKLIKDIYVMLNAGTLRDTEWKIPNPWHQTRPAEDNRPKLIEFRNCDDIQVKGITIKNGLCWIQNYKSCSNLLVDHIKVESVTFWNNDGIDITDCKNARLTNSFFNAADDGICLKSEDPQGACENVYVADCKVRSSASAVKFGTASHGGFKNVTVKNIIVYDTFRSALALESVDGGTLEDINVDNIKATNTGNAIFIRLGHRNQKAPVGKVQRVHISNVMVDVPAGKPDAGYLMEGPFVREPHNVFPSSIVGIPSGRVEDVSLENITINYPGEGKKENAFVSKDSLMKVPEQIKNYPEFSMFGELPAWGFYIRHADGIKIKNLVLTCKGSDYRPALIADDVNGLDLNEIHIQQTASQPAIVLNKVTGANMHGMPFPGDKNKNVEVK